jgi:hypothetical protein
MANYLQARVHVNLPHDSAGQTAAPGQTITVDIDDPTIVGYLTAGYLTPLEALEFAVAMQPPTAPSADDVEADAAADDDGRVELESMTKAQLLGQFEAQTQRTGVDETNTKAEIVAAILGET